MVGCYGAGWSSSSYVCVSGEGKGGAANKVMSIAGNKQMNGGQETEKLFGLKPVLTNL